MITILKKVESYDKANKQYIKGTHESRVGREGDQRWAYKANIEGTERKVWANKGDLVEGQQYDATVTPIETKNATMYLVDIIAANNTPTASNLAPNVSASKHITPQLLIDAATWVANEVRAKLGEGVDPATVNTVLIQLFNRGIIEAVADNMGNEEVPF